MERIVLRHLSGSKANQVEEFPLNHINELVFGRDPAATVKYDPDRDDMVGRQHARLTQDDADPTQFTITDLNSRNGTYVNKQRIVGATKITPGDLIQFGPGGPELQFDLEPRPPNLVRSTRTVSDPSASTVTLPPSSVPNTRAVDLTSSGSNASGRSTVGKATVERMISENIAETKRTESRRYLTMGGVALAVLILVFGGVAGYLVYRGRSSESQLGKVQNQIASAPMTPAAIVKSTGPAVVKIEVAWKLISPEGGLVYHRYGCGELTNKACYIELPDGTIEPLLTYDKQYSTAIGGQFTGSGFVVSDDGFILTNRHVAAAWETTYDFPESAYLGVVYKPDGSFGYRNMEQEPINWIPALTKQQIYTFQGEGKSQRKIKQAGFSGANDRLEVSFPGTKGRINANLIQSSDDHEAALIKISMPGLVPKVEFNDNYDTIQSGDAAIVLGYPAGSRFVFGIEVKSSGSSVREPQTREIADPTLSVGNIGRLLRNRGKTNGQVNYSAVGDAYQLTINSTEAGYSGGPVFDDRGKVIGIFYAPRSTDDPITFAVPIRYGKELMNVSATSR